MTTTISTWWNGLMYHLTVVTIAVGLLIASPFVTSVVQTTAVETTSDAAVLAPQQVRKLSVREYVRLRASRAGWTYKEWRAFSEIVYRESRWNPKADNKHSSAWGLYQILRMKPGTSLEKQTTQAIRYIKERYGSPVAALRHHDKHGWY